GTIGFRKWPPAMLVPKALPMGPRASGRSGSKPVSRQHNYLRATLSDDSLATRPIAFAAAIQAPVFRAASADGTDLLAQSLSRAVYSNSGISRGDSRLCRQIIQTALIQIDDPKRVAVFRFESVEQSENALADLVLSLRRRVGYEFLPPALQCTLG